MKHDIVTDYQGIRLRPLRLEDIEKLREWRNDSLNSRYIRKIPYITSEAQKLWFSSEQVDPSSLTFAIEEDDELVGSVSLYDINELSAEFGRLMIGESKGRGLGTKATHAILVIAFDILGLNVIRAEVSVGNIHALKIYVKAGFCIEDCRYNPNVEMDEYLLLLGKERYKALR